MAVTALLRCLSCAAADMEDIASVWINYDVMISFP